MRLFLAAFFLALSALVGAQPMIAIVSRMSGPDHVPIRENPGTAAAPSCSRGVLSGSGPAGDGAIPVHIGPGEDYRLVQRLTTGRQVLVFERRDGWAGIVWNRRDRLCGAPQARHVSGAQQGWIRTDSLILAPFQPSL